MAVNIPIWNGIAGTVSQSTSYGYYDNDPVFCAEAQKVAKWCASRLGYPVMDVELQSGSLYTAFEEAVTEYSYHINLANISNNFGSLQGSSTTQNLTQQNIASSLDRFITIAKDYGAEVGAGGNVKYRSGSVTLRADQQVYDLITDTGSSLSGSLRSNIEIKNIYHFPPPAVTRQLDPTLGAFGWSAMSTGWLYLTTPVFDDVLRTQVIEFNDTIRRSAYSFKLINNELSIYPLPSETTTLWFDYIHVADRRNPLKNGDGSGSISDLSNARYDRIRYVNINHPGRRWIQSYALAVVKEMLGWVRGKFQSIPFANQRDITLNYQDLLSQAATEKEQLITELKEMIEKTTPVTIAKNKQEESEALMEILKKFPLRPYIG